MRMIFSSLDKKAENLIFPTVIFIILNAIFFGILLLFIFKSSGGALIYEQAYTKQIALLMDKAKPSTIIKLNMEKGKEIAEKNSIDEERIVEINHNFVKVRLGNGGGYCFRYFSDYDINYYFDKEFLIIVIDEKGENKNL